MSAVTVAGLRVVVAVARAGSFTAAAAELRYTQPAVSRQIAAVETALGAPLFERRARGVELTAAGELVHRRATAIIAGLDELHPEIVAMEDRLSGRVALGAFPSAMAALVPRALAALHREHPGLEVSIREDSTPSLLAALRAGRLDVAVVGVGALLPDYDLDDLHQRVVAGDDLSVAVPDDHRLTRLPVITAADLADEPWIVGHSRSGEPQFGAWPTLTAPRIAFTVRSWPARLGLVAAGLGISVIPGLAADSVPRGVRVLPVEDGRWPGRATLVVSRRDRGRDTDAVLTAVLHAAEPVPT